MHQNTTSDKRKVVLAYVALAVFLLGLSSFTITLLRVNLRNERMKDQIEISRNINKQRQEAMDQAKREGKREYSFTVNKAPIAVSP